MPLDPPKYRGGDDPDAQFSGYLVGSRAYGRHNVLLVTVRSLDVKSQEW